MALAADGEYTALVCEPDPPGVACALAEMATAINRVTGVFSDDYFHAGTLIEMSNCIQSIGSSCSANSPSATRCPRCRRGPSR